MKTKRCIALLLCLIMSGLLPSCGSASAPGGDTTADPGTTTEPAETEETDGLPDVDMDGFELSIYHFDESWLTWAKTQLEAESENGDLVNDAIYKRNRGIEERFNCTLAITGKDIINAEDIQREVMAGDSTYDVWFSYDIWALNAVEYLLPWNDIPYINLEKEWWNPLATEVFNIGGNQYAAAGNYSLSVLSRASGYIFNKDIYNELGLDYNIYDLAREGKWTIEKLAETAKAAYRDLNGNADIDNDDRFGITGSWKEFCNRLILGSGINYVSKDADGYPSFDLPGNEAAIEKIMKLYDTFMQTEIYNGQTSTDVDGKGGTGDLKSGGVLFTVDNLLGLENKRDYDIDIGFMPCPKYDEDQEHYYAPSFGAEISILLKTLPEERWEYVGMLLEALAFDSQQNLIPTYKEVVLKTKLARDDESADMIDIIIDSVSFEFGLNAWQDIVANPFVRQTFAAGNSNFASTLASMESSVKTEIEKLIDKLD